MDDLPVDLDETYHHDESQVVYVQLLSASEIGNSKDTTVPNLNCQQPSMNSSFPKPVCAPGDKSSPPKNSRRSLAELDEGLIDVQKQIDSNHNPSCENFEQCKTRERSRLDSQKSRWTLKQKLERTKEEVKQLQIVIENNRRQYEEERNQLLAEIGRLNQQVVMLNTTNQQLLNQNKLLIEENRLLKSSSQENPAMTKSTINVPLLNTDLQFFDAYLGGPLKGANFESPSFEQYIQQTHVNPNKASPTAPQATITFSRPPTSVTQLPDQVQEYAYTETTHVSPTGQTKSIKYKSPTCEVTIVQNVPNFQN